MGSSGGILSLNADYHTKYVKCVVGKTIFSMRTILKQIQVRMSGVWPSTESDMLLVGGRNGLMMTKAKCLNDRNIASIRVLGD